jgi:hypothetical protein
MLAWRGGCDERRRHAIAAMAGPARHGLICGCRIGILYLRHVLGIDIVRHGDHDASNRFVRVSIGCEVGAVRLWIFGVTELAFDAEGSCIAAHHGKQVGDGNVFRKHLQVGRFGNRATLAFPRLLLSCGWRRRRGVLSNSQGHSEGQCEAKENSCGGSGGTIARHEFDPQNFGLENQAVQAHCYIGRQFRRMRLSGMDLIPRPSDVLAGTGPGHHHREV